MKRLMRNRATPHIRELLAGDGLSVAKLVQPIFVEQGLRASKELPGLPGNFRMGIEAALRQIESDLAHSVRNFMLFPLPASKGISPDSGAQIIADIKKRFGSDIHLWVDTCLCSTSPLGHCCLFHGQNKLSSDAAIAPNIDLEATLEALTSYVLAFAQAGADGIAPSDMMDGRVAAIRSNLDQNEFNLIISP